MRGTKSEKKQQHCNGYHDIYFYWLTPTLPGHPSILLFASFNKKCSFDGKQRDMRTLSVRVLAMNYTYI